MGLDDCIEVYYIVCILSDIWNCSCFLKRLKRGTRRVKKWRLKILIEVNLVYLRGYQLICNFGLHNCMSEGHAYSHVSWTLIGIKHW